METKFNFNSQVCTSRLQSEKLLALGLKKETADMHHSYYTRVSFDGSKSHFWKEEVGYSEKAIPAWSLHRLLSLIEYDDGFVDVSLHEGRYGIHYGYDYEWYDNLYDAVISCIEALIKEGYFNKEYLV